MPQSSVAHPANVHNVQQTKTILLDVLHACDASTVHRERPNVGQIVIIALFNLKKIDNMYIFDTSMNYLCVDKVLFHLYINVFH